MAPEDLLIDEPSPNRPAAPDPAAARSAPGDHVDVPHLVHVFPSCRPGGPPLRMINLINRFGSAYRHSIVSLDHTSDALDDLTPEPDVTFAPAPATGGNLLSSVRAIRGALAELKPDLLLTYNWGAMEWALTNTLFRLAPHLHFESGFGPNEAERQLRRRVLFRRLALRRAVRLVVPSRTLVKIATDIWKLAPDKVCFVPNGVDVARFTASSTPETLDGFRRRPGEIIVGTVAPLRREKNLARLLRAFAAVPEARATRLLIVGEGAERPHIEAVADQLGLRERVCFTGHVADVERAFAALDVYAMSSDTEQMPNSLIQAMASGLPVAATDVGDVRLILPEENRPLVVPKEDEAAFAAALQTLIQDAPLRERLGRGNREHVEATYGMETMLRAYDDLYRLALSHRRGDRSE